MAGNITPSTMFSNELNAVKGWPSPYALDKAATWETGETGIVRGSVLSLNANARFVAGASAAGAVAVFALQGQDEFDANSDVGNISGGILSGLVSLGAYELETSEYVDGDYAPNDILTYATAGDVGKVTEGTAYTDTVVGVVSDGELTNDHGVSVLRFWTAWLPPSA